MILVLLATICGKCILNVTGSTGTICMNKSHILLWVVFCINQTAFKAAYECIFQRKHKSFSLNTEVKILESRQFNNDRNWMFHLEPSFVMTTVSLLLKETEKQ